MKRGLAINVKLSEGPCESRYYLSFGVVRCEAIQDRILGSTQWRSVVKATILVSLPFAHSGPET